MKRFKILALVLCVTLMSTGLTGCGTLLKAIVNAAAEEENKSVYEDTQAYADDYDYDYDYEVDMEYSDPYSIDDMDLVEMPDFDEDYGDEDYGNEDYGDDAVSGDMITVGSDQVGYVDLASNYVKWNEIGGMPEGSVQYCDGTSNNIVTMVYYDMPGTSAMQVAQGMAGNLSSDTAIDPDSLDMATVTLGGVDAYQIYAYYPTDGLWLVVWIFESPYDSYVHYVSAEFPGDDFTLFHMVEDSYRFIK